MGTTLSHLGPQLGQAAGGFVQGRQLRTQEDETRQGMALRAAEEGRAKESHRLNIQQLGLAIQGLQQAQEFAAKRNPQILEQGEHAAYGGRQMTPGAESGLEATTNGKLDLDPSLPYSSALDITQLFGQNQRAKDMNNLGYARVAAAETPVEKPLDSLKVLENNVRQLRTDMVRLNTDLTGGRIKKEDSARAQAALRRIQFDLLPKAEKAVQDFRTKHPELGAPTAAGSNDLLSDD